MGHGAGPAEEGTTPAIRAHCPCRMTARESTALGRRKHESANEREAATPGRLLGRPAHGGGVDSRVGDVVVFGAHCPARTTARVGAAPSQLKMA